MRPEAINRDGAAAADIATGRVRRPERGPGGTLRRRAAPTGANARCRSTRRRDRAHVAPATGGAGLTRLLSGQVGQPREGLGDLPVAVLGCVLVAQGGVDAAVPESLLEVRQGCAGHRGHRRAGVAQVVEAEVRSACRHPRRLPVLVQRRRLEVRDAVGAGKEEGVRSRRGERPRGAGSPPERRAAGSRPAGTRRRLRRADDRFALHPSNSAPDPYGGVVEVDVAATQL